MTKKADLTANVAETVRSALGDRPRPTLPAPLHPSSDGMSRQARPDLFALDPKRIVVDGFYIREPEDENDNDFDAFVDTLKERGEVDIPLSVRTVGAVTGRQYILVWGRRRLAAALRLKFALVPVRSFGEITETDAIKLQLQENLNRRSMTPAQTAYAFHELVARGVTNQDISVLYGKDKSYVSYLVRTGEALAELDAGTRRRLNRPGMLSIRECQEIAKIPEVDGRIEALRKLSTRTTPVSSDGESESVAKTAPGGRRKTRGPKVRREGKRRADEQAAFHARELRGGSGRTFRVRWTDNDLDAAPDTFVQQLADSIRDEIVHVMARLETRRSTIPAEALSADTAEKYERATRTALQLATWLPRSSSAELGDTPSAS